MKTAHFSKISLLSSTLPALVAACGAEDLPVRTDTAVLRMIELRHVDGDVASGLDLDGFTSDEHDGRTCFKEDFVDDEGRPGIDNQLATLLPLVDLFGEGALQGLIQNAINEGRLLVFFDVEQYAGGKVKLTIRRGDDVPLLGTDGFLLSGQTLGLHAESMLGISDQGQMTGTVVTTDPFPLEMPVIVFSRLYLLALPDARIRFELTEDGRLEKGVIAGSAGVDYLIDLVKTAAQFGNDAFTTLDAAIIQAADLDRDPATGGCRALSAAINFDAIPAYVFE